MVVVHTCVNHPIRLKLPKSNYFNYWNLGNENVMSSLETHIYLYNVWNAAASSSDTWIDHNKGFIQTNTWR